MYLTQEDYRKIEQWLQNRTIKDTEFPPAEPLKGDERVVIIQDEANRLTNIDTLSKYIPQAFVNITDLTGVNYDNMSKAIKAVPEVYRKKGTVVTFNLSSEGWQIIQFLATPSNDWNNVSNWINHTASINTAIENLNTKTHDNELRIAANERTLQHIVADDGKIKSNVLPSFVDDVVDVYATYNIDQTGALSDIVLYLDSEKTNAVVPETGKIYQNSAEGEPPYQFRWSGANYIQVGGGSLIIGEVEGTAYDGGKGKENADNLNRIATKVDTLGINFSSQFDYKSVPFYIASPKDKITITYNEYDGSREPHVDSHNIVTETGLRNYLKGDSHEIFNYAIYHAFDGALNTDPNNGTMGYAINEDAHTITPASINYVIENFESGVGLTLEYAVYNGNREINPDAYNLVTEKGLYNYLIGNANNPFNTAVYKAFTTYFEDGTPSYNVYANANTSLGIPPLTYSIENHGEEGIELTLDYNIYEGNRELNAEANNFVTEKGLNYFLNNSTSIGSIIANNHAIRCAFPSIDIYDNFNISPIKTDTIIDETYGRAVTKLQCLIYPGATKEWVGDAARDLDYNAGGFILENALKDYLNSSYALATTEKQGLITPQEKKEIAKIADKASISDLSNVLGEEVIDEPLLSEINVLTREEIKKDLFDDLWLAAWKLSADPDNGGIDNNATNERKYLANGLKLTYNEAIDVYAAYDPLFLDKGYFLAKIYTNIPPKPLLNAHFELEPAYLFASSKVEAINVGFGLKLGNSCLANCTSLHTVHGTCYEGSNGITGLDGCSNLQNINIWGVKKNGSLRNCSKLSLESLQYLVTNAANTSAITITVHPDVYAKLTGDTSNAAAAALTPEEAAQWQQIVTDATNKQITFATV